MAEFLIIAIGANHSDSVKDKAGCYKRGDVVVVMSDGWQWGRLEGPPRFVIIKIPGMSVEEGKEFIKSGENLQEQVKTWNYLDWQQSLLNGDFLNFIEEPTPENVRETEETILVDNSEWAQMQITENYYPFTSKPKSTLILLSSYGLTGMVSIVDVRGNILAITTRRKYEFQIDTLPIEIKTELESEGVISISEAQFQSVLKDKVE